ncbi:glycosyltransferase family 9 protein [uncultured Algibacter sp.]|uniref:glycosyltransferase family 9 protein n=1 Tax=uncultured Algibacter sp. TaxID=298659 RepID=UPI003216F334
MGRLTKHIGQSQSKPKTSLHSLNDIKKILICRPNQRLGNQLLLTPLVQELTNTFPNCKIDLFVKGNVAEAVFKNYTCIDTIIKLPRKPFNHLIKYGLCWLKIKSKRYDLVINGDKNSSSGRLSTKYAKATHKVFGDIHQNTEKTYQDFEHISKYPIYNLRHYLSELGYADHQKTVPLLNINLSDSEIAKGKIMLRDKVNNDKKTICIYTNATRDKCYSENWWETFYTKLKTAYSDYNIIEMLPVENISKINFKAPHIYSTDIHEMAAIIKQTSIFITADNGIMHLASASLTPTVGFFSVTHTRIYEPYGNKSIAINTNETSINDWFEKIDTILNS